MKRRAKALARRKGRAGTALLVLVTAVAVAASLYDQRTANRTADRDTNQTLATERALQSQSLNVQGQRTRQAGQDTASIYIARIQIERDGLIYMWKKKHVKQTYMPVSAFALSVSDASSLLDDQAPADTITDISILYGKLLETYSVLPAKLGATRRLTDFYKGWICADFGYAHRAETKLLEMTPYFDPSHDTAIPSDARTFCKWPPLPEFGGMPQTVKVIVRRLANEIATHP